MAESIKLTWKGRAFFITRDRIMRARRVIENIYSMTEMANDMHQGKPRLVALSEAYTALLNFAGAKLDWEEVYEAMFGADATLGSVAAESLLKILIPDSARAGGEEPQEPNPTPPLKNSSKSRSAKAG